MILEEIISKYGIDDTMIGDMIQKQHCYHDTNDMCRACYDPMNGDNYFCACVPCAYIYCKTHMWSDFELQCLHNNIAGV